MTAVPTLTDVITEAVGPLDNWANQCHAASLALVKSGVLLEYMGVDSERFSGHAPRVARGTCHGVGGQHSWVVVGDDVFDRTALIVDITLWSYDPTADRVWVGNMAEDRRHNPKGSEHILNGPKPYAGDGDPMPLTGLSASAAQFLRMIGDLDAEGWARLWTYCGMQGWPATEVLEAFLDQYPHLAGLVPIDVIGHLTERNPEGLYW